jgi:hypothetical protein
MTTPATSVEDQSLFDAIAGLLPAELREHFYRRMAHLRNLTPMMNCFKLTRPWALSHALAKDLHRALAVVSAGALIVGFFLGVFYFQWIRQP